MTGSADDGGIADSSTLMSDYEYVDEGSPREEVPSVGWSQIETSAARCPWICGGISKRIARCVRGCADVCRTRRCCGTTSPNGAMTKYCEDQANGLLARINDESWSRVQYLWGIESDHGMDRVEGFFVAIST